MAPSTLRTCSIVAATLLAITAILAAANAALAQQSSPLPAPELTAQPADRAVNLTWTEVAGAARYELWSWRNQETGWLQIGGDNLTGASYTHSNLIAGATYYYQIRAVNADGDKGDWSARVSAATPPALDAPELTAQAAAGAVQLNWTEVDTAVRYVLWSWWNEEAGWQQLGGDNLTATSYTHTELTVGTTYYYQMRAENAAGESSDYSQRVSATVTEAQQSTSTPTPTPTPTSLPILTPTPTPTPTPALSATPTSTTDPSITATPTSTPDTSATDTPTPTPQATSTPTSTPTSSPTAPLTLTATPTATPAPTSTPVPLSAPVLTAQAAGDVVELSWDAVPGAVRYLLWTWTGHGGLQRLDGGDLTATAFTHQGAEPGTTYQYTLGAVNSADQVGPWSPWVPATLPGPLTLTPAQIFAKVSPAIAYVKAGLGSGSGFLIEGGYLVTAAHVVWPETQVRVVFPDGTEFAEVAVRRLDLIADLAVLGPFDVSIKPVKMVDGESIPIGSRVHFIGYPGEYELFPEPTITGGLLSRLRQWDAGPLTMIQTDATIVPGQSGGALVSDTGDVVGLSNFGVYGEFGLAISTADLLPRIQQLIAGQDPGGHGDRLPPPPGGALRHSLTLQNYWDDQAYIIHAPPRTEFGFSLLGTKDSVVSIYDYRGIDGETFDTFEVTGFEYGAYIFGRLAPNFLIIRQKATTPGNFVIAANHRLVPVKDPDSGQTIKVGQSIHGNMDFPTDSDYFFLDLQQGQTVEILAQSILADMLLTLSLRGSPSPSQTVSRDGGAGLLLRDSRMVFRAPVTARYYLIVTTFEPEAPGGYILTVNSYSLN